MGEGLNQQMKDGRRMEMRQWQAPLTPQPARLTPGHCSRYLNQRRAPPVMYVIILLRQHGLQPFLRECSPAPFHLSGIEPEKLCL